MLLGGDTPGEITPYNLRYTPELRGYLMWGYLPLFVCFRWPYIYIKSYSGRILGTLWCFINSYMGWITWGYVTYKQYGCIFSSLVHKFALKAKVFVLLGQDQNALPSHMKTRITQTGLTSGQGEWDPKPRHPPFIQENRSNITIFHPQDIIFEQLNSSYSVWCWIST
jgi:hypothetical protein